ncbi:efflux RND transporter periplasmic adaptor subunit [Tunicatimonas pelagia]|uniref:efflux RND transporter periplasmic adaptor subunit n=1 Tax=Tunicatimonas pelagia TaxID=931531 RepID=UPI002666431B|nr:HlyD family efflux transporter periplasmic adaptor subunit [Tunicatimonas pelagia]WKN45634.1 HlyD family efflux transporter periplasmic adaptor subunit [Tunicatimonas pelagia]
MKYLKFATLGLLGIALSITLISYVTKSESKASAASSESNKTESTSSSNTVRLSTLELIPVENREKTIQVPVSGRVVPKNQTQLLAEVQGRILPASCKFKAGQHFKRGEVLLYVDSREFALNLEAQKSAFLNILTGIMPDLKADYPNNYQQWLTYVQAYDSGQPLQPLPETSSEGEKYFITSNQVYNTFYSIKAQEERLNKYTIRAPYAGLVTDAMVDIGGMVSPGQLLGTLISSSDYELEAGVTLEATTNLSVGDKLTFQSNEIAGTWIGEVVRINDIVDPQTQNIPVFFQMQGPSLKSGMYLEGTFATRSYEDVFVIPQAALSRDESVLILEENVIVRKAITPVEYLRDSIIVQGLTESDQLILNQFGTPVEGKKVYQDN